MNDRVILFLRELKSKKKVFLLFSCEQLCLFVFFCFVYLFVFFFKSKTFFHKQEIKLKFVFVSFKFGIFSFSLKLQILFRWVSSWPICWKMEKVENLLTTRLLMQGKVRLKWIYFIELFLWIFSNQKISFLKEVGSIIGKVS